MLIEGTDTYKSKRGAKLRSLLDNYITMIQKYQRGPYDQFVRFRSSWRRTMRLLFPSPMEMQLVRLLGGYVLTFHIVRHYKKPHFPLSIVIWWPKIFRQERVRREVRCGRYWMDFSNDIKRTVEVLSSYHTDILKDQERHEYITGRGYRILYIHALDIIHRPEEVRQKVTAFLTH